MPLTKLDQVQHRYLLKSAPDVLLDQVQFRYLVKSSYSVELEQITNRYLIKNYNPEPLDYTLTPHQYFINGIKNEMYLPVKENYISFSNPEIQDGDAVYNSTVRLNVDRESGFKGYKTLNYNRSPITALIFNRDVLEAFRPPVDDIETTTDVLRHFNTYFGTKLAPDNIVNLPVVEGEEVKFISVDDSFFFMPNTEVSLGVIKGSDRYSMLPANTLSWSTEILEGIWSQGLDISTRHAGLTTGATFRSELSDDYIKQFYDDPDSAPTSTHPSLKGNPLTVRSTAAPIISDRARTDCVNAVTVVPNNSNEPIIFHYDLRQR